MFDLDHLEDTAPAEHLASIVGAIVRLLLATTTAGFFYLYGAGLFAWLVGVDYGAWLSAAVGVFLLDGLAYLWPRLRERSATTAAQMTAGAIGTIADLGASVLVTLLFVVLQTAWVETVDASGQLTTAGLAVNIAGLVVMTGGIVGNGLLIAYFEANGAASRRAAHAAELRALTSRGQFEIERNEARLVVSRTLEGIGDAMPTAAERAGRQNAARYLSERFAERPGVEAHVNGSTARPTRRD